MRLVRTRMFSDSLTAPRQADSDLFEVVAADLQYLLRVKRGAELPQVLWGLAQSAFRDVTGEVRSHVPGRPEFVRVLFAMPEDESVCVFAVMGDKNTREGARGNDWYNEAIPILDAVWRAVLESGDR